MIINYYFSKTSCRGICLNILVCYWISHVYVPQKQFQLYAVETASKNIHKESASIKEEHLSVAIRLSGLNGISTSESFRNADCQKL